MAADSLAPHVSAFRRPLLVFPSDAPILTPVLMRFLRFLMGRLRVAIIRLRSSSASYRGKEGFGQAGSIIAVVLVTADLTITDLSLVTIAILRTLPDQPPRSKIVEPRPHSRILINAGILHTAFRMPSHPVGGSSVDPPDSGSSMSPPSDR